MVSAAIDLSDPATLKAAAVVSGAAIVYFNNLVSLGPLAVVSAAVVAYVTDVAALETIGALFGAVLAAGTLYVLGRAIYNVTLHPLAKYPGPKLWAAFWWPDSWSSFRGTAIEDLFALHRKYGRIVRTTPEGLSFTDARAWKDIYGFRPGKSLMGKDPRWYNPDQTGKLPPNIIVANDVDHARYRRSLAHAFSDSALRGQEQILTYYFDLFIRQLNGQIEGPNAGKVDLMQWYNFFTFDLVGDLSFGSSFSALENGKSHPWIDQVTGVVKFSRWLRLGGRYPFILKAFGLSSKFMPTVRKSRQTFLNYTKTKVEDRLDTETDRNDFLGYVLRSSDEKGMSRGELVSNAAVLILAGSETSATLLSGATYHLLQNPEKLKRLNEEVRGAFSSLDEITLLSSSKLPYLHAVIEESLRLYPPVAGGMPRRVPQEGGEIAGEWIPGDMTVYVHQYSAYRDPENFTDPDAFVPERFLPKPPAKYRHDHREALQPFSFGPRNCLGRNLAYNEMRSILARVVFAFDMELMPESQEWTKQKVYTLWQKPPLMVQLRHSQKMS